MSTKEKWKTFGKNTGQAFKNFGQAVAKTANIVVDNEQNDVEENGKTKLRNTWTKTGKGFGEAGSSLGKAAASTVGCGDDKEEVNAKKKEEPKEEKSEDNNNQEIKQIEQKDQQ